VTHADWVWAVAVVGVNIVLWSAVRWRAGRRRRLRVTVVVEREYDGPQRIDNQEEEGSDD